MEIKVSKKRTILLKAGLYTGKLFRFDALWAYHPRIIEEHNRYFLFYTGKRFTMSCGHTIGYAESTDLKHWEKSSKIIVPPGEMGEWDSDFTAHPFILKEKEKYIMYYDGSPKEKWLEAIGVSVSTDLRNWKKLPVNPIFEIGNNMWESKHVSRCSVLKEGGKYFLFYTGHDGTHERIGMAEGNSPFSFKRRSRRPIIDLGQSGSWDEINVADPKVIKYKNKYVLFYSGIDKNLIERVGVAISRDLITWRKYAGNPILNTTKNGWDKVAATRFDLVNLDGRLYLLYSGKKSHFWSIGCTELKIND